MAAAEKSDVFNLDRTHQAGQVRALLSVFIYSVIIIMATAGGGTYDVISAGSERSIDAILQDCCEVANESDFLNKTNDYRSVFQHSVRFKYSTECFLFS